MLLEERFLDLPTLNYVLDHSAKEPPLLLNLRKWTEHNTEVGNMICGPVIGQLLNFFVRLMNAQRIVELGTFTGYSALYMAEGLGPDAKIITCEMDERHAKVAQGHFDLSPHGHKIDLRLGPAAESLKTIDGPIDLAFIDADKKGYPSYFENLVPKMRKGGLIVVDNVMWGGKVLDPKRLEDKAIAEVNDIAIADTRVKTILLPIRDGLLLCMKN